MIPARQSSPHDSRSEVEIVLGITSLRLPLRGYLHTLVPDRAACDDLVQDTLLFLWERRGSADASTPLRAWAFKVAWFKAMAWHRDHRRDRLVYFPTTCTSRSLRCRNPQPHRVKPLEPCLHCLAGLAPEYLPCCGSSTWIGARRPPRGARG
jgi:DNA-directed RNA polymerase specialized sigma24 family protein